MEFADSFMKTATGGPTCGCGRLQSGEMLACSVLTFSAIARLFIGPTAAPAALWQSGARNLPGCGAA